MTERKLFVSDQLLETILDNLENTIQKDEGTRQAKRYASRFMKLVDNWFDGTTGPRDVEELRLYLVRLKKRAKDANPAYVGFYDGIIRHIEDVLGKGQ